MSGEPMIVRLGGGAPEEKRAPAPLRDKRRKKDTNVYVLIAACGGILVAIAGWYVLSATGFFSEVNTATPAQQTSDEVAAQEIQDVIREVEKLIVLPEGEEPTVATVSDPSKLAGQPFFARAKVGDKVLIYTKAQKAYLYDPAVHRLLEVAPITTEMQ